MAKPNRKDIEITSTKGSNARYTTRIMLDLLRSLAIFAVSSYSFQSVASTQFNLQPSRVSTEQAAAFHCSLIEPPATPVQFMSNLKCAIQTNTLYKSDFSIDDKKLSKLFGGISVDRKTPLSSQNKEVFLSGFSYSLYGVGRQSPDWNSRLGLDIQKSVANKNSVGVGFTLNVRIINPVNLNLTFSQVQEIFGKSWKTNRSYDISVDAGSSSTATSQLRPSLKGNTSGYHSPIEYQMEVFDHAGLSLADIIIRFNDEGLMNFFETSIAEK